MTVVLKWVKQENEKEITEAFKKALIELNEKPQDWETIQMDFFETLARTHREAEGAPFTGLKPAGEVEPIVKMSDAAIASGSIEEIETQLAEIINSGIEERFDRVIEAKKHKDESVEAGREYVKAYIEFIHGVENLYNKISAEEEQGEHTETAATNKQ